MLAALLGAATELAGFRASFPHDAGVHEVVRRKRVAAVLVDAAHASARDEALLGRALMSGTRVIVFGRARELDALKPLVDRYELVELRLPQQLERLSEILAQHHPLVRPRGSVKR